MNSPAEPNKSMQKPNETRERQEQRMERVSYESVAELAYFKALKRNFEPGHEVEDWLEAEKECAMNKEPEQKR